MFRKKRTYLDWAAGTPLAHSAFSAMKPWLQKHYGNPSAIHDEGVLARQAVEKARTSVARVLGVRPVEVFFTGSGTEANNLAINGLIEHLINTDQPLHEIEVITTAIEHPSVSKVLQYLQRQGLVVHYAPLDEHGLIDTQAFSRLLNERTRLVTVAHVNSEIGVIQPIKKLTRTVRQFNREHASAIKVHIDSAQAPLWLSCDVHQLGVDIMTLDAGKFCGPKGVGVLIKLSGTTVFNQLHGGGQEAGLRAGTENVAGIVGTAVALEEAQGNWQGRQEHTTLVRDNTLTQIQKRLPTALVNGPLGECRVANNINLSLPGIDTEYLAIWLNQKGFAVSTKSACSGAGGGESRVVKEIYHDKARASSTIRLTLGPDTNEKSLSKLVTEVQEYLATMSELTQK
jgi:cysteine desulfurase